MAKREKKAKGEEKCSQPISGKVRQWRKNMREPWVDTLFDRRLLDNPALMTNDELATALVEYQEWRRGKGKYHWDNDPIEEKAEVSPPFSPEILGRLLDETIARLEIVGDLTMGRL